MTKRFVTIAYRNETSEKEMKTGLVELLLDVLHKRVKAHLRRQDPAYAGPSPHM